MNIKYVVELSENERSQLMELVSKREVFIAREMTKLFETFYWGEISQVLEEISTKDYSLKGEFVIVIKGKLETPDSNLIDKEQERILKILLENMKKKENLKIIKYWLFICCSMVFVMVFENL